MPTPCQAGDAPCREKNGTATNGPQPAAVPKRNVQWYLLHYSLFSVCAAVSTRIGTITQFWAANFLIFVGLQRGCARQEPLHPD